MLLAAPQLLRRDRGFPGGIVIRGRGAARDIVVYRGRELPAWSSGRSPQADTLSRTVASISSAKSFCMDFLPFVFR